MTATPMVPKPHTPIARVIGTAVALTAVVVLIVLAFSWPSVSAKARDVPIAITGPTAAVTAVQAQLTESSGDLFDVSVVEDRAEAVRAIKERNVVGAVVLGQQPELLTAPAAGTASQVISGLQVPLQVALTAQAEAAGQAAPAVEIPVTSVVPYSDNDPNGTLMSSAFFPLLIGGMLGGILISIVIIGSVRRVVAVSVYSIIGGLVLGGILQGWFGSIQGNFWINAAAIALALAAIAAPIIGFVALIGRIGLAVGPVVMMLFANPISGATLPAQYLPGAWGAIGQWFPPGASATLIRGLSYFPDANATFSWLVLAGWVVGGFLLTAVGHFRTSGGSEPDRLAAAEDALPIAA